MFVVSAMPEEPPTRPAPQGLDYGMPVTFRGNSGFYHPAAGAVGVVMCAPWGFEELTLRKGWRLLAEAVAAAGYPCIRFDYPGTGNSLGRASDVNGAQEWIEAINQAAECLRLKSGVKQFVFLGQSLGAALAVAAARTRNDVVGLQLVAPVVRGRAYVRELAATASLVAQRIGIAHAPSADEALSVVGFPLSQRMVDSLKTLEITDGPALRGVAATIFDTADRKARAEASEHLKRAGATVRLEAIAPYHLMISDATALQPLPVAADRIVAALRDAHPTSAEPAAPGSFRPAILSGAAFREEALRFGPDAALFGILCHPLHPRADAAAVVLLNRGLNAHLGWRRVSVDHARTLAASGIASLRFDVAGLGESRDEPGRPANLIYSDLLLPDIAAAVDLMTRREHRRVALAGVCSGAYMALLAAQADARVSDVFAVNAQRLVWNPAEHPDDVIRYGLRSMNDYVGDIRARGAWRKLIRSRKRIAPALHFLVKRNLRNAMARLPLRLRSILLPRSMAARVDGAFRALAERGTRIALVFTADDPGLAELRAYFGPLGRDLRQPNVSVAVIPGADHNLTATAASDEMLARLCAFAEGGAAPEALTIVRQPQAAASHVVCRT